MNEQVIIINEQVFNPITHYNFDRQFPFLYHLYRMQKNDHCSFMEKPFIGFEPMTYALPWRYSTAELKGPARLIQKI